jgi:endoglucanase
LKVADACNYGFAPGVIDMFKRVIAGVVTFGGALSAAGCAADLALDDASGSGESAVALGSGLGPATVFYAPPPNPAAKQQVKALKKQKRHEEAALVKKLSEIPHAVWLVGGTPKEVRKQVRETLDSACSHQVPVFVLYNVPYRDCAQYSAGGATDTAAYKAWIDAVAKALGSRKAIVIIEPDGLGIMPYNSDFWGTPEWCQPTVPGPDGEPVPAPGASATERYAQLNYAVSTLESKAPNAVTYLDATHASWLGVGEAAHRLIKAGVSQTRGFFLNVSNYRSTEQSVKFGSWISGCITAATEGAEWALGHPEWCPSQYNPELGYQVDYSPEYSESVSAGIADMLGGATPKYGFVIDTGRNGQGPWTPSTAYPDAQDWCNPPGRGAGITPTANSGVPLLDAYLWIKVPGESDGSCNRGIAGSTTDPEWGGIVDPAAGQWFPEQALELATLANPAL